MSKLIALLIANATLAAASIILIVTAATNDHAGDIHVLLAATVIAASIGLSAFIITRLVAEELMAFSGIELMAGIVAGLVLAGVGSSVAIGISGTTGFAGFFGTFVGLSVGFVIGIGSVYCLSAGTRYLVALLSHRL